MLDSDFKSWKLCLLSWQTVWGTSWFNSRAKHCILDSSLKTSKVLCLRTKNCGDSHSLKSPNSTVSNRAQDRAAHSCTHLWRGPYCSQTCPASNVHHVALAVQAKSKCKCDLHIQCLLSEGHLHFISFLLILVEFSFLSNFSQQQENFPLGFNPEETYFFKSCLKW